MTFILIKLFATAAVIVLISEIAKISDKLGALIASLPLITFLTLIWLYVEKQDQEKIANHAYYTFWYVLPTLPMFLLFPFLLKDAFIQFKVFSSYQTSVFSFLSLLKFLSVDEKLKCRAS